MVNTKFEVYKLRRELRRIGKDYEFTRKKLNKFKEPTKDVEVVGSITGIYHEAAKDVRGVIEITTTETTQVRSKRQPMILCLYEEVDSLGLKIGDEVKINSRTMKVTGIVNIQEWNIIADISLEVVDVGVPT